MQCVTRLLQLAMNFFFQIASCNTNLLCEIVPRQEQLQGKLQRDHFRSCNLSATCLAPPLPDKLQEKLHRMDLTAFSQLDVIFRLGRAIRVWLSINKYTLLQSKKNEVAPPSPHPFSLPTSNFVKKTDPNKLFQFRKNEC